MSETKRLQFIVKLGGAAITLKERLETIDEERLNATCMQLGQAMRQPSTLPFSMDWSRGPLSEDLNIPPIHDDSQVEVTPFIVVHGAGSFGHFQASRSGVNRGCLGTTLVNAGFVATRISVCRLNQEVVRRLAGEGIPAVGVSPFSAGWSTSNRSLEVSIGSLVTPILDAGFIPVLHGDAVLDFCQGCTILSGDVIVRKLAQELKPRYVIFLTNVPGVFDRPPSEHGAVLLEEIVVDRNGCWTITKPEFLDTKTAVQTTAAAHDTTGGMATKIAEAAAIAMSGIDVYIVEIGTIYALEVLKGAPPNKLKDHWVGTAVRASSCNCS